MGITEKKLYTNGLVWSCDIVCGEINSLPIHHSNGLISIKNTAGTFSLAIIQYFI